MLHDTLEPVAHPPVAHKLTAVGFAEEVIESAILRRHGQPHVLPTLICRRTPWMQRRGAIAGELPGELRARPRRTLDWKRGKLANQRYFFVDNTLCAFLTLFLVSCRSQDQAENCTGELSDKCGRLRDNSHARCTWRPPVLMQAYAPHGATWCLPAVAGRPGVQRAARSTGIRYGRSSWLGAFSERGQDTLAHSGSTLVLTRHGQSEWNKQNLVRWLSQGSC